MLSTIASNDGLPAGELTEQGFEISIHKTPSRIGLMRRQFSERSREASLRRQRRREEKAERKNNMKNEIVVRSITLSHAAVNSNQHHKYSFSAVRE